MARTTDTSEEQLDPSLVHKKKARRRLVGALAFLGATAVGLPFLLDAEPKPSPQEVQIRVPAREPMTPGGSEAPPPQARVQTPAPIVPPVPLDPATPRADVPKDGSKSETKPDGKSDGKADPKGDAKGDARSAAAPEGKSGDAKAEAKADGKSDSKGDVRSDARADAKSELKSDAKADAKSDAKKSDDKKADAKKADDKKAEAKKADAKKADDKKSDGQKHYSVQIGAFSNEDTAKEQLAKAAKLGLKTYTEKVSTASGTRYRARVGPFNSREQADQALAKLKMNGVDAAIVAP